MKKVLSIILLGLVCTASNSASAGFWDSLKSKVTGVGSYIIDEDDFAENNSEDAPENSSNIDAAEKVLANALYITTKNEFYVEHQDEIIEAIKNGKLDAELKYNNLELTDTERDNVQTIMNEYVESLEHSPSTNVQAKKWYQSRLAKKIGTAALIAIGTGLAYYGSDYIADFYRQTTPIINEPVVVLNQAPSNLPTCDLTGSEVAIFNQAPAPTEISFFDSFGNAFNTVKNLGSEVVCRTSFAFGRKGLDALGACDENTPNLVGSAWNKIKGAQMPETQTAWSLIKSAWNPKK